MRGRILVGLAALTVLWGAAGCPGRGKRPLVGPPPEYESPRVLEWDSGVASASEDDDDFDPFEAAAEGEWVGGEEDADEDSVADQGGAGGAATEAKGGKAGSSP